ncbi:hypothetical protein [Litoribrevibacter albus]|uniref:Uncharacterized protein n=1 Tax=Litoribrevibacter albus TaxID=1473156 RepID=A0AA37SEB5_9GAMM|nr:hypothetical protein [Litoribrevibacter albus]GLQ32747.1 hypothetical protein GCM10007876_32260 [Litoribrevibacter albus]
MESSSITKFKEELVRVLPFFPNNKDTQQELLDQSISSVMFHYIHWASRFVPSRRRKVIIDPQVTKDSRWKLVKERINILLAKVRAGEDLTPYLSLKAHTKGYTPSDRILSGEADCWDDKDFLLNTMGFHHFHLGKSINAKGISERTNEVIFARVSRDEFHVAAIFDHSVFDSDKDEHERMNEERTRLWKIYDDFSTQGLPPGTVYMSNLITTSGHPLHIHDITREYTHVLNELDHKINNREFENSVYEETKLIKPRKNKLVWHINDLDLGLLDKANQFFIIRYGPV